MATKVDSRIVFTTPSGYTVAQLLMHVGSEPPTHYGWEVRGLDGKALGGCASLPEAALFADALETGTRPRTARLKAREGMAALKGETS